MKDKGASGREDGGLSLEQQYERWVKHEQEIDALLLSQGYRRLSGQPDIEEVLGSLTEYQRSLLNVFCEIHFKYSPRFTDIDCGGFVVSPAASEIHMALLVGLLPSSFGLEELKAFLIRNDVPMRSDWKGRLELLPELDATETTAPSTEPEPIKRGKAKQARDTGGKGGRKPKDIWRKKMVQACLDSEITSTAKILEAINTYSDEQALTDDDGNIVDAVEYHEIRHDKEYIDSGRYANSIYLKRNKSNCGNGADIQAFKKWLRKDFRH